MPDKNKRKQFDANQSKDLPVQKIVIAENFTFEKKHSENFATLIMRNIERIDRETVEELDETIGRNSGLCIRVRLSEWRHW